MYHFIEENSIFYILNNKNEYLCYKGYKHGDTNQGRLFEIAKNLPEGYEWINFIEKAMKVDYICDIIDILSEEDSQATEEGSFEPDIIDFIEENSNEVI